MNQLTCELCGSNNIIKQDGLFVCQDCGAKYSVNEAKKMMSQSPNNIAVSNNGTYLALASNAYMSKNYLEAELYSNRVIESEPDNYRAWMIKGKAAGWQSSLNNLRIFEAASAFAKAVAFAPSEEREQIIEDSKNEIANLSLALLSLRDSRFVKWPDQEETNGFNSDILAILNAVQQFIVQARAVISTSDILSPSAKIIGQSAMKAYQNVIKPDYKSDRYPFPNDNDFHKYIDRIDYCVTLLEKAVSLSKDEDDNIQWYENLIYLQNEAIGAVSYSYKYFPYESASLSDQVKIDICRRTNVIPVLSENRYYYKDSRLTDAAVAYRRGIISQYESKIREIRNTKKQRIAAEEQKAKEEVQRRIAAYWEEHPEEKECLETEKKDIEAQIKNAYASRDEQIALIDKEIADIPGKAEIQELDRKIIKLNEAKSALGFFKGKEKKSLQEQIDQANNEIIAIKKRREFAKDELESRKSVVRSDMEKKVKPLQDKLFDIITELNKER